MPKTPIPIHLDATLRQEVDKSLTIVVEISGIPTTEVAREISTWLRQAIRENADLVGELNKPPT
jgi:transcriptional regulator GlxA family with amidase domain